MNKKSAFIWDLDGTLLYSYEEIVSSVILTLDRFGIKKEEDQVLPCLIRYSVKEYFSCIEEEYGIPFQSLDDLFQKFHISKYPEVTAAPHAMDILDSLKKQGIPSFVFTHRGRNTTLPILEHLDMLSYFEEILCTDDGFARKPDPQAVSYLLDKYSLDPARTYFVGDRKKDMECGKNAGIKTILYLPSYSVGEASGDEDYVIRDFPEILRIITG